MSEQGSATDVLYVCAGICRVNPRTNLCAGCGRPWDVPAATGTVSPASGNEADLSVEGVSPKGRQAIAVLPASA